MRCGKLHACVGCDDCKPEVVIEGDAPVVVQSTPPRAHYIGAPEFFLLNQACTLVQAAFGFGYGVYLVGSSLKKRDYRDVDLRCIISDEDFERLFPGLSASTGAWRHPLWSLMCSSISLHLSRASGLPIDFQIQSMTVANRDYPSPEHRRNAVGLFYKSGGVPPQEG